MCPPQRFKSFWLPEYTGGDYNVTPEGVCANLTTLLSPDKSTDLLLTLRFYFARVLCAGSATVTSLDTEVRQWYGLLTARVEFARRNRTGVNRCAKISLVPRAGEHLRRCTPIVLCDKIRFEQSCVSVWMLPGVLKLCGFLQFSLLLF